MRRERVATSDDNIARPHETPQNNRAENIIKYACCAAHGSEQSTLDMFLSLRMHCGITTCNLALMTHYNQAENDISI